jgi:hypothetical protein
MSDAYPAHRLHLPGTVHPYNSCVLGRTNPQFSRYRESTLPSSNYIVSCPDPVHGGAKSKPVLPGLQEYRFIRNQGHSYGKSP